MKGELYFVDLIRLFDQDNLVTAENFNDDVYRLHEHLVARVRSFLLPEGSKGGRVRFTPFETAGYYVFRNPSNESWNIKTTKGVLTFPADSVTRVPFFLTHHTPVSHGGWVAHV